MGFVDKLKSLFVVEDESTAKNKKKAQPKKQSPSVSPPTSPSTNSQKGQVAESSQGSRGQVTAKFMNILLGAMEKHNLDGFDYIEFKESLKSLEKMPMDERTRFQSAFAMAKTMGATPQKIN